MIETGTTTAGTRNDEDTDSHVERINVWEIYTVPAYIPGIGVSYPFVPGPLIAVAETEEEEEAEPEEEGPEPKPRSTARRSR